MESRSQATLHLTRELVDDVERSRLGPEAILLKALRLALLVKDNTALQWLRFEINGYPDTPEARHYMEAFGRFTNKQATLGYWKPLGVLAETMATNQAQIQTLQSNLYSAPSSANRAVLARLKTLKTAVSTLSIIRSRVLAVVHIFAVSHYHALAFDNLMANIFDAHRSSIDGLLAKNAPEVLEKMPSISDRLTAGDPEAVSQAMNSVRRMIKCLADHVYPGDQMVVMEGQGYEVGSDKVLKRLKLFLQNKCSSSSRRERLTRAIRGIHERVSAGAHADITHTEARALLLGTYLILGEIVECGGVANPVSD